MAKRQQVQSAPSWGTVATTAQLPNVAGATIQSANLEVGDTCQVTAVNAVYRCTVATLGAARWTLTYQNAVIVQAESDLPAAVAGVITLAANTVYYVYGTVTLTAGNRIVTPPTAATVGGAAPICAIVGNVNAALYTISDPTATVVGHLYRVTVQNTNAGAAATAVAVNLPLGTAVIEDLVITSAGIFGCDLLACASVNITGSSVTGQGGLRVQNGASNLLFEASGFTPTAATGAGVDIVAGVVAAVLTMLGAATITSAAGQFGVRVDAAATITSALFERVVHFGAGTFNSGWDQTVPGYRALNCTALPNSVAGGGSSCTTQPSTIATGAQNVWQDISNGAAIYSLDSGSERFVLNAATNGEIKYVGHQQRKMLLTATASWQMALGGAQAIRFGVWKNGALIATTIADADAQSGRNATVMTVSVLDNAATNDRYVLRVMNLESTNSMIFQSVGISAIALGF